MYERHEPRLRLPEVKTPQVTKLEAISFHRRGTFVCNYTFATFYEVRRLKKSLCEVQSSGEP